jgi:hypothetical protein
MKKLYVRTEKGTMRQVYLVYVEPKLRTAYGYFKKALLNYLVENDEEIRALLRRKADAEMGNVYRVAFGKC